MSTNIYLSFCKYNFTFNEKNWVSISLRQQNMQINSEMLIMFNNSSNTSRASLICSAKRWTDINEGSGDCNLMQSHSKSPTSFSWVSIWHLLYTLASLNHMTTTLGLKTFQMPSPISLWCELGGFSEQLHARFMNNTRNTILIRFMEEVQYGTGRQICFMVFGISHKTFKSHGIGMITSARFCNSTSRTGNKGVTLFIISASQCPLRCIFHGKCSDFFV